MNILFINSRKERVQIAPSPPRMVIGRSRRCEISDPFDGHLSREHAELMETSDGWRLADLGSKNGTYHNERLVDGAVVLANGDVIDVGSCRIEWFHETRETSIIPVEERVGQGGVTVHSLQLASGNVDGLSRVLVDAAREIVRQRTKEETLHALLELALRATGAERGMIARCKRNLELEPMAVSPQGAAEAFRPSRSLLKGVVEEGKAVINEDTLEPGSFEPGATVINLGIRSVLCVPLGNTLPPWGVLYLDSRSGRARFQQSHLEVISTLGGMINIVHENEKRRVAEERQRRLDAELDAAASMQRMLLPESGFLAVPEFGSAAHHRPTLMVGGDIYDFFEGDQFAGVMLADVSGKGLAAALMMANFHAWWHAVIESGRPPQEWLAELNKRLYRWLPDNRFITLAFGVVDRHTGDLIFASAGHAPALVVGDEGVELLMPTGPPLGLIADIPFEHIERPLRRSEKLLLFSDGVLDQRNQAGEDFGLERVERCVSGIRDRPPDELVRAILDLLEGHAGDEPQDDDTTIAVMGRRT